jgi:hypothetical protein
VLFFHENKDKRGAPSAVRSGHALALEVLVIYPSLVLFST